MHTSLQVSKSIGRRGSAGFGGPLAAYLILLAASARLWGAQQAREQDHGDHRRLGDLRGLSRRSFQDVPKQPARGGRERRAARLAGQGLRGLPRAGAAYTPHPRTRRTSATRPSCPRRKRDKICLSCHLNQPTQVGRIMGPHAKNQVGCASCHSIHNPAGGTIAPRKAAVVNQLCAKCHTQQWASFQRPYKHRLPEGAMSCVDCHNPHGGLLPKALQTVSANEPGCLKCHGDKRGPYAYEHAPVRLEGCMACHQPHGSANPRMLTRQEVRLVCLECHANLPAPSVQTLPASVGTVPPAFHDLNSPRYRNCTICHVKIHGSNVSGVLLR